MAAPNAEPARVGGMTSPQEHAEFRDGMPDTSGRAMFADQPQVKEGTPSTTGGRRGNGALH